MQPFMCAYALGDAAPDRAELIHRPLAASLAALSAAAAAVYIFAAAADAAAAAALAAAFSALPVAHGALALGKAQLIRAQLARERRGSE